ncbi:PREDICTED: LOC18777017 isoform, partial [Prunus dulcis]
RGFKMNCRPFIGLDACHLKGVYGGQLLTAIGIDPNNETWVLASAVVEMETRESWTWFIDLLAKDVDIVNSHGWAFISDKQKGLPGAFEDIVPNAKTRFCVKHLWDNFNKMYKGKVLRDQLWTCARATNVPCFKYQMKVIKALDSNAWEWLAEKPPTQWSKSHFKTHIKCDMLQNNLCESFNN